MAKKRIIIIDGNSLAHRAYYALPPLKTEKGEITNAIYGFASIFLKSIKALKPEGVICAFDAPGPSFRHKKFKDYKAQRQKAPEELYAQIPKIKEMLGAFRVPFLEISGLEADDIIAALATRFSQKEDEVIIITGDMDALALVSPKIKVWTPQRGFSEPVLFDENRVKEKYEGLLPSQLDDYRGLCGDQSDNIPGAPGVGKKTAIELLLKYKNLEGVYKEARQKNSSLKEGVKNNLIKNESQAFLSRDLARVKKDASIKLNKENIKINFDRERIGKFFQKMEFFSLIDKLPANNKEGNKTIKTKNTNENAGADKKTGEAERHFKEGTLSRKIYEIEKKLSPILEEMSQKGVRVDKRIFLEMREELGDKISALKKEIFKEAGEEFNPNSPSQVSKMLFQKMNIPSRQLNKTPKGAISTSASELKKIKEEHKIVSLILDLREIVKIKTGFLEPLLKEIKKDGRIHPTFHQFGAETGRISCSNPNLQNIPARSDLGNRVRKGFIPREGYLFLSADYSQIELRIAAYLAGEKEMIRLFEEGADIHKQTASLILGIPVGDIGKKERFLAKSLNFGIIYGMGAWGLSERTALSFSEAKKFINDYFQKFPLVASFREKSIKQARENEFVETIWGRRRVLKEINSKDNRVRNQAERMAVNTRVQGSASDIIKKSMILLKERGVIENNCSLLLQIHDELLFEVLPQKIKEKGREIKKIMENIIDIKPKLKVNLKAGDNWKGLEEMIK